MPKVILKLKEIPYKKMHNNPSPRLYTPQYRLKQLLWRFHKADADDQISIPHGDAIDGNRKYQLNPYTGEIFHKKDVVADLQKKEYTQLWEDKKFLYFVAEARKVYSEKYPDRPLPSLPVVLLKKRRPIKAFSYRRKMAHTHKPARLLGISKQEYTVSLLAEFHK